MKRYLIEINLNSEVGFKGKIRDDAGYRRYIEKLRKTRQLAQNVTQKLTFEYDYTIDPPIDYYINDSRFTVTEINT